MSDQGLTEVEMRVQGPPEVIKEQMKGAELGSSRVEALADVILSYRAQARLEAVKRQPSQSESGKQRDAIAVGRYAAAMAMVDRHELLIPGYKEDYDQIEQSASVLVSGLTSQGKTAEEAYKQCADTLVGILKPIVQPK